MSAISVIIPCHNRALDLKRVLEAYDNQDTTAPFELIAIDDASSDGTDAVLRSFHPRRFILRVERLERNQGPAAARNHGIALATAPLLLFTGDDICPEPNLIEGHLQAHRHHPESRVAILGRVEWAKDMLQNTLMTHIDGIGAQQFSYHYFRDGAEYDFRHLYTCNVSLKRDFLCSLDHWFDTDFLYPAFEDAELGYRLARRGLRIIYNASLLAYHYHYHTIWSFSVRQYNCGRMAWLITRKHPLGVGRVLYKQYVRVLEPLWLPHRMLRSFSSTVADWLEAQVLHLASFYEWTPHKLLDNLYLRTLDYFYYKGLIDGIFERTPIVTRLRLVHAAHSLVPLLRWFVSAAHSAHIPFPYGNSTELLKTLASF